MKSLVIIFLAMFATSANANDADKCFKILSTDGQYFIIQIVTVDGLVPKTPLSTSLATELRGDWAKLAGLIVGNDEFKLCVPNADGQRDYKGSYIIGLDGWAYQGDWEKGYFNV